MSIIACPSCRSSITIPPHHTEATIRCGICWTEVALPSAGRTVQPLAAPAKPVAPRAPARVTSAAKIVAPAAPAKPVPVAAALPANAKPAAGMARLEALIHKATIRLTPPPAPAAATPVAPVVKARPVVASPGPAPVPVVEGLPAHGPAIPAPIAVPQQPVPTPIAVSSQQPRVVPVVVPSAFPPVAPIAINSAPAHTPIPITPEVIELSADDLIDRDDAPAAP